MMFFHVLAGALLPAIVPAAVSATAAVSAQPASLPVVVAGTFAEIPSRVIPPEQRYFQISGKSVPGDGAAGAEFAYDPQVDAAYVAANPHTAVRDAAGRGFRFVGTRVTPWLFGATGGYTRDRTMETPERAIPVDNSAALERFFAYVARVDRKVDADWRGNWGISRPLVIDQPRWNRQVFQAGQLFALAPMEDMLVLSLNDSRMTGRLVLIGGAGWSDDPAAFADRRAVNGLKLVQNRGAEIDQVQVANVRSWAVYDHPDVAQSNNIDLAIGHVRTFGTGASPVSAAVLRHNVRFSGRSDIGAANDFGQMSVLTVTDSSALAANALVRIGGEPYLLVDKPSRRTVRVYPWLPRGAGGAPVASGTIESMQGGTVLFQNNNAAGVRIGRISAQNCGVAYWSRALYGPSVGAIETQYCGTAMAFGAITPTAIPADRQKLTMGNRIDGHHSEQNGFDIVAVNHIVAAAIGEPTAMARDGEHWARRLFTLRTRLADLSPSYGGGFYGIGVVRAGVRHTAKAGTIGTRQDGVVQVSNERGNEEPVFVADTLRVSLVWQEEYSRTFPGRIDARATIVGTGPNRQPTGTITVAAGQPGYTVNGRSSLTIDRQPGRIEILAVKQDGTNNWLVSW